MIRVETCHAKCERGTYRPTEKNRPSILRSGCITVCTDPSIEVGRFVD